jgi:disulfide bond formation protein DsbB
MIRTLLRDGEALALGTLALCGALVAGALVMEHAFGHVPCPLCLMQRIWFLVAGLCIAAGLLHDSRLGIYPLLATLAALVGGGFSIRQLWLQSLPPDQVPACMPPIDYMIKGGYPGMEILRAMTQGTGDCAKVDWSFLGLSFAGWALVGFAAVIALGVLQLRAVSRLVHR